MNVLSGVCLPLRRCALLTKGYVVEDTQQTEFSRNKYLSDDRRRFFVIFLWLLLQEEAQARFWACEVGKRDFTSCFILADKGDEPQITMRLHFRYIFLDSMHVEHSQVLPFASMTVESYTAYLQFANHSCC